jgi:hypothetical protein
MKESGAILPRSGPGPDWRSWMLETRRVTHPWIQPLPSPDISRQRVFTACLWKVNRVLADPAPSAPVRTLAESVLQWVWKGARWKGANGDGADWQGIKEPYQLELTPSMGAIRPWGHHAIRMKDAFWPWMAASCSVRGSREGWARGV